MVGEPGVRERGDLAAGFAAADVIVENFRPGVLERLGFSYERCHARNPRLIYCSISGFGHHGLPEWTAKPGYDLVLQGMGGLQGLTGPGDGAPFKVGTSIADLVTGMLAYALNENGFCGDVPSRLTVNSSPFLVIAQ